MVEFAKGGRYVNWQVFKNDMNMPRAGKNTLDVQCYQILPFSFGQKRFKFRKREKVTCKTIGM